MRLLVSLKTRAGALLSSITRAAFFVSGLVSTQFFKLDRFQFVIPDQLFISQFH